MNWKLQVINVHGYPVKVYINPANTQAVVFPLFGKYYQLSSDTNVLDFATTFLVGRSSNVVSFSQYLASFEDTAVIQIDKIAA